MVVSLLIRALRQRRCDAPEAVPAALNRTVAGSFDGGSVTCCAVPSKPNGSAILADAGHLSPLRNGHELALVSGLPPGIVNDAEYADSTFDADDFTFVSGGVIEGANVGGEMVGFERTAALAKRAKKTAAAAQASGQNDDITVVTVRRVWE